MEQIKIIAMRIKEIREIFDIDVSTLAKQLNVSVDTYKSYEAGEVDIPVSFLYAFANRFNIQLTDLLTGDQPKLRIYSLVRKGHGVKVERRKEYEYESLAYNFSDKKAEPFLVTVEPKDDNGTISFNTHPGQEFNYVIEGTLKVIINEKEIILKEGDSLYFDATYKHAMRAVGGKRARFLAIII